MVTPLLPQTSNAFSKFRIQFFSSGNLPRQLALTFV
jgi:hypothetical protein